MKVTNRERDVLNQLILGKSNDKIAEAIGITASTVKFHVSKLTAKLRATLKEAGDFSSVNRVVLAVAWSRHVQRVEQAASIVQPDCNICSQPSEEIAA